MCNDNKLRIIPEPVCQFLVALETVDLRNNLLDDISLHFGNKVTSKTCISYEKGNSFHPHHPFCSMNELRFV